MGIQYFPNDGGGKRELPADRFGEGKYLGLTGKICQETGLPTHFVMVINHMTRRPGRTAEMVVCPDIVDMSRLTDHTSVAYDRKRFERRRVIAFVLCGRGTYPEYKPETYRPPIGERHIAPAEVAV